MQPKELKQILVAEGFQVFRVLGSHVVLADRVRENLIMDSGVAAVCGDPHRVQFVVRAQSADYPEENEQQLFERARVVGATGLELGFVEQEAAVVPVADPVDEGRMLDTWYELRFEKEVSDLDALFRELHAALALPKLA